ncbi:MAG: hypothetical protein RIT43_127 [Bacteroidota bacterium]|jgi:ABC-type phosphate transport system substrate-binding protein
MRYSVLILLLLIGFSGLSQADWGKVTVVGNTLGTTSLTKSQVSSIFKGMKSRWKNDEEVIVVMPSTQHVGCEIMAATIFGKDMKYVKKYWLTLVFQGRSNPPVFLDTNEEILNYVKKHEGAIGILINSSEKGAFNISIQ